MLKLDSIFCAIRVCIGNGSEVAIPITALVGIERASLFHIKSIVIYAQKV
jgi:hypothetical protein